MPLRVVCKALVFDSNSPCGQPLTTYSYKVGGSPSLACSPSRGMHACMLTYRRPVHMGWSPYSTTYLLFLGFAYLSLIFLVDLWLLAGHGICCIIRDSIWCWRRGAREGGGEPIGGVALLSGATAQPLRYCQAPLQIACSWKPS